MEPTPLLTQEEFEEILLEWNNEKQQVELDEQLSLFTINPNTVTESRLDSFALPGQIKRNLLKYREAGGSFKSKNDVQKLYGMTDSLYNSIEPFIEIPEQRFTEEKKSVKTAPVKILEGSFDPNTASNEVMKDYGLNDFQANNIIAYRESGGSYSKPEDLLKIYGIDSVAFGKIRSFIRIESEFVDEPVKTKREIYIDINRAETTDLMQINGIGEVYAQRIIKYRDLLGGYYNTSQLKEVYGFSNELFLAVEPFVYADTTTLRQIRINYADFAEMIRHPYFDKSIVNAILNEKDKNGPIKNIAELTDLKAIDSEFIEKIRPYVSCR
ncbi:helix-hairpin-helix domain-containing protein [Draconibacterium sp. IB214405]|uniref:helix-hairpin-helix domain-containing protein n=1 Tax=Draconibacterium sp. IB214405 TaxID=3097352 RepID=UPI002A0E4590|nr:helix-hairpin-helix domain-containing protein [Draconibacterium sp. IB214405]MDX8338710.1 helix-hairpin-helix domain-containing protein [Draconibacterium sp. IB214405]